MDIALVLQTGDLVLMGAFLVLVLMSVLTWGIIITRTIRLLRANKANKQDIKLFWQAKDWQQAKDQLLQSPAPLAQMVLMSLKAKHKYGQKEKEQSLATSIPLNEYLVQQIRNAMFQVLRPFDSGMTTLASIGATAPFVGLFGTVWGIYHALINISSLGQVSIAAVSGPIGEALVATAAGLFVAIPAVLAYNAINKGNKNLAQDLDNFAHDLHIQLMHMKETK